jgi:hypothetical protein
MPLSKKTRWSLIAAFAVLALLFGPLALIMASNLGAGILDLLLNRKPTTTELVGDYKLDVPWGTSSLHINSDGTFQELIMAKDKPQRGVSGNWQISREDSNFLTLDFRPFGMVWDDDHDRQTNIYGIDFYKPHFGATYGLINDDLDEKFVRQQGDINGK